MKELCLQHILLPDTKICTEAGMYYRYTNANEFAAAVMDYDEQKMILKEDTSIAFDTYFNMFPADKWKEYTLLNNLKVRIVLEGSFIIDIFQEEMVRGSVVRKDLFSDNIEAEKRETKEYKIDFANVRGQISFSLRALDDQSVFWGGGYYASCGDDTVLPRIGVDICTFHREKYVYRNFRNISDYIKKKKENLIENQFFFYIVDNGQSLEREKIPYDNVKIISQEDSGSTGGFTRGMIEMLQGKRAKYDYVLVMDDDILFEPEVLERTCVFCALLKPEYKDYIISGQNLDLNLPWIQHENGGYFDEYTYYVMNNGFDMRYVQSLFFNHQEQNAKVAAWWYACFPGHFITDNNLPYPMFFHCEDMEYSARNKHSVILMNGIGIWHESFFNKTSAWHTYYDIRNKLILNTLCFPDYGKKQAKKLLRKHMLSRVLKYRYKECEFLLEAYSDFLKGPKWMRRHDDAQFLESKIEQSYKLKKLDIPLDYQMYEKRLYSEESRFHRLVRILTLNGYVIPSSKQVISPLGEYSNHMVFRAKCIVNYDFVREKGYIVQRSWKKAVQYFVKMILMSWKTERKFETAKRKYQKDFSYAVTAKAWKKKLNIQEAGRNAGKEG